MSKIHILVGSVYGGAEQVAELAAAELEALGHEVTINTYASAEDLAHDPEEILLLCHSNTGSGELPDNLQPLYLHLTRDYPPLSGRRFGVINLADSSYITFNEAGVALATAFEEVGAQRVGDPLVLDASSGEDTTTEVRQWISSWARLL